MNKEAQTELSSSRKLLTLVQLHSFAQLLENMHRIEVIPPRIPPPHPFTVSLLSLSLFLVPICLHSSAVSPIAPAHLDGEQMEYHLSINRKAHQSFKWQNKMYAAASPRH